MTLYCILQEAENSLKFFRGVRSDETNEIVLNEFNSIKSLLSVVEGEGTKVTIKDFRE